MNDQGTWGEPLLIPLPICPIYPTKVMQWQMKPLDYYQYCEQRSKEANQAFSPTRGTASVRVVKGKWIILHLEHGGEKKKCGFGGEGEIAKKRRRRDS